MKNNLDQIGKKYGTDKASNEHDYCNIYDQYLLGVRDQRVSIIEIGVGGYQFEDRGGESLRMWYEYFSNGKIIGIDLHKKINIVNDRTEFWQGSQIDDNLFQTIIDREKDSEKRILIDDASHNNELMIKSFELIFPLLQPGDLYIVEDVHTSYFDSEEFGGNKNPGSKKTSMHYFTQLAHQLNYKYFDQKFHIKNITGNIEFIHFYSELVIIKRK